MKFIILLTSIAYIVLPMNVFACENGLLGNYIEIETVDTPAKLSFNENRSGTFSYSIGDDFYLENIKWEAFSPDSFKITYYDEEGIPTAIEVCKCMNGKLVFVIEDETYKYEKIK